MTAELQAECDRLKAEFERLSLVDPDSAEAEAAYQSWRAAGRAFSNHYRRIGERKFGRL